MFKPIRLGLLSVGIGLLMIAGCSSYGPYPARVGVSAVYVDKAPPARPRVVIPPPPSSVAVWIDGYWNWAGVQFVWIDGFWDSNPPRAKHWAPDRWMKSDRGWYRRPGQWHSTPRRRRR